jgi:hypothetical protein
MFSKFVRVRPSCENIQSSGEMHIGHTCPNCDSCTGRLVNKCDWIAHFTLFSQFMTCLGRIVHHSPKQAFGGVWLAVLALVALVAFSWVQE